MRDENKPLAQTAGHYVGFESKNKQLQTYWGKIGTTDKPFEVARINGQEIQLVTKAQPDDDGDFYRWWEGNPHHGGWIANISKHLEHARYGRVSKMPGLDDNKAYFFAQGNVSTSLPTTRDNLTYRGRGLMFNFGGGNKKVDADSEFTVNFFNKTVNGTLSGANTVRFSADIQGSHFSSKDKSAVEVKGAFYGADAAEMAGVFRDTGQNIGGAFGAKKQQ